MQTIRSILSSFQTMLFMSYALYNMICSPMDVPCDEVSDRIDIDETEISLL